MKQGDANDTLSRSHTIHTLSHSLQIHALPRSPAMHTLSLEAYVGLEAFEALHVTTHRKRMRDCQHMRQHMRHCKRQDTASLFTTQTPALSHTFSHARSRSLALSCALSRSLALSRALAVALSHTHMHTCMHARAPSLSARVRVQYVHEVDDKALYHLYFG